TVVIASPDRQQASGADLLQQARADELVDRLSGGFVFDGSRQFNRAIIALRSRGQNDELRIGESCHRDPPLRGAASFAATTTAPPRPCSRRGRIPEAHLVPGTVTVPLCSRTNASPFWIMLLLVWGRLGHAMIAAGLCDAAARWSQAHPGVTDQVLENTKRLRPGWSL